jgi:hypothetical protein
MYYIKKNNKVLNGFFSEYQIVFCFFSLLLSLSFFLCLSFLYSFQTTDTKRKRRLIFCVIQTFRRWSLIMSLVVMYSSYYYQYIYQYHKLNLLIPHPSHQQVCYLYILIVLFFRNVLRERRYGYMLSFVSMNIYQETDVLHLFVWNLSYDSQFSGWWY